MMKPSSKIWNFIFQKLVSAIEEIYYLLGWPTGLEPATTGITILDENLRNHLIQMELALKSLEDERLHMPRVNSLCRRIFQ